jgi:hypothetical protein
MGDLFEAFLVWLFLVQVGWHVLHLHAGDYRLREEIANAVK